MKLVINKSTFENVVSQMQPFLEKKIQVQLHLIYI